MLQGSMAGSSGSGGSGRAVHGLVQGHAAVRAAASPLVQQEGGGGAPSRPLTVPLGRTWMPPGPDAISTRRR